MTNNSKRKIILLSLVVNLFIISLSFVAYASLTVDIDNSGSEHERYTYEGAADSPNTQIFKDKLNWPSSRNLRTDDDTFATISLLAKDFDYYGNTAVGKRLIDMNGDGLTDIIFYKGHHHHSGGVHYQDHYLAVFSNTGNNGFENTYKCFSSNEPGNEHFILYYGDCAAT